MAKLISVPSRLFDELVVLKKDERKRKSNQSIPGVISFIKAYELRYQRLKNRYDKLKEKCDKKGVE